MTCNIVCQPLLLQVPGHWSVAPWAGSDRTNKNYWGQNVPSLTQQPSLPVQQFVRNIFSRISARERCLSPLNESFHGVHTCCRCPSTGQWRLYRYRMSRVSSALLQHLCERCLTDVMSSLTRSLSSALSGPLANMQRFPCDQQGD